MCELRPEMLKSIPGKENSKCKRLDRNWLIWGTEGRLSARSKGVESGRRRGEEVGESSARHPGRRWLLGRTGWYFILGAILKVFKAPTWEKVMCQEARVEKQEDCSVSNRVNLWDTMVASPRIGGIWDWQQKCRFRGCSGRQWRQSEWMRFKRKKRIKEDFLTLEFGTS